MKYWVPPIVWVLLIFVGSGDVLSAEHTSRFVEPFLRWLSPNLSADAIEEVHIGIRKAAHVIEYAILAILICRAVMHNRKTRSSKSGLLVALWVVCALVAAADEYRQSFAQSRGSSPWDVMIDAAGALVGLTIYWVTILRIRNQSTLGNVESHT